MGLKKIYISFHALDMFCERYKEIYGDEPSAPKNTLKKFLASAAEIRNPNSHYQEKKYGSQVRYFKYDIWRFVVNRFHPKLITVYYKKPLNKTV